MTIKSITIGNILLAILLIGIGIGIGIGIAVSNKNLAVVKDPQGTVLTNRYLEATGLCRRTNLADMALLGDGALLNLDAVSKPLDMVHLPLETSLVEVHLSLLTRVEGMQNNLPSADNLMLDSAEPLNLV